MYGGDLCVGPSLETAYCLTNVSCPSNSTAEKKKEIFYDLHPFQLMVDGVNGIVGLIVH